MVLNLRSDRSRSSFGPKSKLSKDNFQAMINLKEANNSPPLMSNHSLSGQKCRKSKTPTRNEIPPLSAFKAPYTAESQVNQPGDRNNPNVAKKKGLNANKTLENQPKKAGQDSASKLMMFFPQMVADDTSAENAKSSPARRKTFVQPSVKTPSGRIQTIKPTPSLKKVHSSLTRKRARHEEDSNPENIVLTGWLAEQPLAPIQQQLQ